MPEPLEGELLDHGPGLVRAAVDDRVHIIATIMARGEYERGVTAPTLAADWGVPLAAVEHAASAAGRLLRALADPERSRELISLQLDRIAQEDAPDRVAALRTQLEVAAAIELRTEKSYAKVARDDRDRIVERMRVAFRDPDPLTAEALAAEGWTRT